MDYIVIRGKEPYTHVSKIKEPYTPPHIFTAKNLASEHLSTPNTSITTTSHSQSSGGSVTPPQGIASYLKALLPRRPPNPNSFP
jgi:hypothetical protein